MTGPDDRWPPGDPIGYAEPPEPPPARRRGSRLTPVRVVLTIALVAAALVVAYGLVARDATQIPVLTAGVFLLGLVFILLALAGAWAAYSRARDGESARALGYALLGGLAALLAAGSFASATILTLTLQQ